MGVGSTVEHFFRRRTAIRFCYHIGVIRSCKGILQDMEGTALRLGQLFLHEEGLLQRKLYRKITSFDYSLAVL